MSTEDEDDLSRGVAEGKPGKDTYATDDEDVELEYSESNEEGEQEDDNEITSTPPGQRRDSRTKVKKDDSASLEEEDEEPEEQEEEGEFGLFGPSQTSDKGGNIELTAGDGSQKAPFEQDEEEEGEGEFEEAGEEEDDGQDVDFLEESADTVAMDEPPPEESQKRRRQRRSTAAKSADPKKKKVEVVEEVWVEPTYEQADYVSGPILSANSDLNLHTLRMYQSYGYDCLRPYNLHVLDDDTLAYVTGNYVHFYSITERQVIALRRSASGYGVGHIAIHPSKKYFAVAEKGNWPYIMIYTWPQQKVYRVLRNGTTRGYSYVNFNSLDEDLLCSQGMDPDYLLTIWNWKRERIVLHVKAFSQDVYRATFSTTHPGQVTTCGLGHIRFWKMAQTFTGLKLQGLIGRFGKTEISDIHSYAGLPDAKSSEECRTLSEVSAFKVVSGSEWGNMLVWDGGLIVVEIIQKAGKNCHDGEITDIVLLETGELVTVGLDGCLRLWESEVVDLADTIVDDSGKYELEPINELKLSTVANPVSLVKRVTNEDESVWLIQDGWGKVWSVNLGMVGKEEYSPSVMFLCPGGPAKAIAASTAYSMFVVGTSTGHLWLFEHLTKQVFAKLKYNVAVTRLIWLPIAVDPKGLSFLASFSDGNVRLFYVERVIQPSVREDASESDDEFLPYKMSVLQILRFHSASITVMILDDGDKHVLYTCGEDRLIFASSVYWDEGKKIPQIKPLSYVTAPFPVVSLDLHPVKDYRLIIASKGGRVAECRKPIWEDLGTTITYNGGKLHGRRWTYVSVKSKRRREERRDARKIELEKKLVELKADIAERRGRGVFVEEEIELNRLVDKFRREQLADDEQELYIPEKPCPVYHVYYQINKALNKESMSRNFFVHVGGYDVGYVYECKCSRPEAGGFHVVPPTPNFTDDVAVRCFTCSPDNNYLIFGMQDGSIRVMPRLTPDRRRLLLTKTKSEMADSLINEVEDAQSDAFGGVQEEEPVKGQARKKKIALQPFPETLFPYDLSNFVCLPMHDPDRGVVHDFAWSYDGKFLFSVGEDGSIFSYRWDPEGKLSGNDLDEGSPLVPPGDFPIPEKDLMEDNQNPNALTLEEQKIKAEKDRIWELAEGKKEVLRKKIRELKSAFRYFLQKNNEIPEEARIPRARFEIEPSIREPKKLRLMKGVEEVYRRYEWQSAKSILQIEKIEKYFLSEIETFHVIVKDITHESQTHTFRHRILTREFDDLVIRNDESLVQEEIQQKAEMELPPEDYSTKPATVTRVYAKDLIGDYEQKKYDSKTMHQIRQLEDRLRKRYERELKWAELNAQKIPDDYEDRADVIAIMQAKENLGDYKLKSSDDYTGEKISAAVRRKRVIDMKLRIHEQMKAFNKYVLDLREEKYEILSQCRELEKELRAVQRKLPPDLVLPIPPIYDMEPCEEPEKQFKITPEMIETRINKKLGELGLLQRREAQKEFLHQEDGQMARQRRRKREQKTATRQVGPPTKQKTGESGSNVKARKAFFKPKTTLANVRLEMALQFRCFQQESLLKKLNSLITYFRNRVERIRDERVALQLDILLMCVKRLNLVQELDIVKEFDSTERAVLERFSAQKVETQEAKNRMDRVQRRLGKVKTDLVKMEQAISDVQKEVAVVIGEKQKFADFLWRVYKKKIRLDNAGDEEGSETAIAQRMSSSSSSTGESTDSTSQDSGSDLFKLPKQKLNPNVCPDQLDKGLYEKVCELRAKRTQLEIEAEAQKKVVEKVERDFKMVEGIFNKFTGRLEGIGEEVLILQRKKQAKMNALPSIVVLKADQIQCLDEDEFDEFNGSIVQRMKHHFPDVRDVVLFPKDGIGKLDIRIEELKDETSAEREKQKRARHMMVRLREELNKLEQEVSLINLRCKKEMVAKFGKTVDLDDVCAAIINLEILDELMRLENRRNWHYRERKKIADEIDKARDRLTFLTKENSENNTLLAILIERQRDVEYFLFQQQRKQIDEEAQQLQKVSQNSGLSLSPAELEDAELISNEDALEELFNLEDILTRQESRIMILREAIAACKFKSGLPPLIPLRSVKDDIATSYLTMNELYSLRERRNLDVETLFVTKEPEKISESHSNFPSFVVPPGSAAWGEPQIHTPFDAQTELEHVQSSTFIPQEGEGLQPVTDGKDGIDVHLDQLAVTDDEDLEVEEEEEEEEILEEFYSTDYRPTTTGEAEHEDEDEEGSSAYPLNIIPDDQMPAGDEDIDIEEEVQGDDYEEDPLPVERPMPIVSDEEEIIGG